MANRGRPSGSVSYIPVKLSDLNKILHPDAIVLVDRRYGALLDANNCETSEVDAGNAEEAIEASKPVDFKVS